MESKQGYCVVAVAYEIGGDNTFLVDSYSTPEDAVRGRILHGMWYDHMRSYPALRYEMPGHPDWRYSEQGRIDHAQFRCILQDELLELCVRLNA